MRHLPQIAVVTPAHPARVTNGLLKRAMDSMLAQTLQPAAYALALDTSHRGAGWTRQDALDMVSPKATPWVTFLDSDDFAYPHHLATHWAMLHDHDADVAYSWFDGNEPFPMHRGRQWNPAEPHHITMTVTVRTELAKEAGFVQKDGPMHQDWSGEDWQFILKLNEMGAKFIGTGEVTWTYFVHLGNTSGLPTKGDAR